MESEVDSFTVESVTRGYHIYEEPRCGEVLVCCRDTQNRHDPFATCKGTTVVGHIPRWISTIRYVFLGLV